MSEPSIISGPPLDDSGILVWRLLHFILNAMRTSAEERESSELLDEANVISNTIPLNQEEQGRRHPDEARVAREYEALKNLSHIKIPKKSGSQVLASRLQYYLANQLSSAEEKLGDRRLDQARELAERHVTLLNPEDMEIARSKILHASNIRDGLDSKSGLSRLLQAREYSKSAKEALRFVKIASDKDRSEFLGQQRPMGSNLILVTMDSVIDAGLCAEMKPKVTTLVEHRYHFSTSKAPRSIRSNAKLAEILLRDMNFIYPDSRRQNPYNHPVIQEAINETLFCNKDDVGVKHHEYFSPMPIPIIALILTVVQCCIEEWSDGTRKKSSWFEDENKTQTVYSSHVSSLLSFQAKGFEEGNLDVLCQLQCDLLKRAREHARVPPYPGTESESLSRKPTSPDSPPEGSDHGANIYTSVIVIEEDS